MNKEQLINRHARSLKSLVGTGLAQDECRDIIKYAINEALTLYGVSKRYKFTFKDEEGLLIIVHEDTERKAFKKAFRTYETPKNRELTIVSKELNVC